MIVYEENTKRIVVPSGLGNLAAITEKQAEENYQSGYTVGKAEGIVEGYDSAYTQYQKRVSIYLNFQNEPYYHEAGSKVHDVIINGRLSANADGTFHGRECTITAYTCDSVLNTLSFVLDQGGTVTDATSAMLNSIIYADIISQEHTKDPTGHSYTLTFDNAPIYDRGSYNYGFNKGDEFGYDRGYQWGRSDGYTSGYSRGYADGQASCPGCSGSTDCSSAITEAFESGYTAGYNSGYSAGQADCESGCNDYLECRTTVSFAEDTVIPTPSVGVSNYIFYNLDMAYTFVYGAEGWEHNGESLHSIIFNEVTLPAGTYEFKSILKQNGEWYTSGSGSLVIVPNDTIPGGGVGSRFYYNEEQ